MNVDDGRLRAGISPDEWQILTGEGWLPVPGQLEEEAKREFQAAGVSYESGGTVTVDLASGSPLANWAAEQRAIRDKKKSATQKKRQKRKAARAARARNRR